MLYSKLLNEEKKLLHTQAHMNENGSETCNLYVFMEIFLSWFAGQLHFYEQCLYLSMFHLIRHSLFHDSIMHWLDVYLCLFSTVDRGIRNDKDGHENNEKTASFAMISSSKSNFNALLEYCLLDNPHINGDLVNQIRTVSPGYPSHSNC